MKDIATKAVYAAMGAPMVARRRLTEMGSRMIEGARKEYSAWAEEGEKVGKQIRSSDMVEELSSRIDLEEIQGRVDKVRDQLDDVLANWRESFRPEAGKPAGGPKATKPAAKPAAKKAAATKPAAKKPAAKTTAAKKPAAKKPAAKKPAAKKPAAKKPAAKKPAAKSTGAKTRAARETATASK